MIIFRYLTKEVYATLLATTLILLLVFITNQFIQYLGRAASGGIPAKAVMQLMSLQVPLLLGYLLPLGLFLGILLTYGRLYVDHEMTVFSACGISKLQLLGMTMGFSAIVAAVVAILTLWLEPKMAWYRDHIFAEAAIASPLETIFPGRFQTLNNGRLVFYVSNVSRDHKNLQDVFVAHMPDKPSDPTWSVVSAQGGYQWVDPKTQNQFVVLTNGYRYSGAPGRKDFQIVQYDQYGVQIPIGKLMMRDPEEFMPTAKLWQVRNNPQAAAELQWRLTMPVAALLLGFLAVPLSRVGPRSGRFARLLPAILIYIVYANLIFLGQASIQKGTIPPLPGLWMVHLGVLILAIILMLQYVGWKRVNTIFKKLTSKK